MKFWSKFLGGLAVLLLAPLAQGQLISPTGLTADPASDKPGDTVSFKVAVSNGATVQFGDNATPASANFTLVLTNKVTQSQFVIGPVDVRADGDFVAKATVDSSSGILTPGAGTFTIATDLPTQTLQTGEYKVQVFLNSVNSGAVSTGTYSAATTVITVTGKPDLQITGLQYPAGTDYVGGKVVPMILTYRNNPETNGVKNVPYTPNRNGHPQFARIQVVLSSNPTFGDADDQQLTFVDIAADSLGSRATATASLTGDAVSSIAVASSGSGYIYAPQVVIYGGGGSGAAATAMIDPATGAVTGFHLDNGGSGYTSAPTVLLIGGGGADALDADGVEHTFRWNQVLPNNFTGSYYVLAKIDSLDALDENDPPAQTVNGDNVWSTNSLNPSGTLITLLAKNAPSTSLVSHGTGATTASNRYSDNPAISTDGRFVAFASDATNLVPGDTNGVRDVFLFDNQTNLVRRLSVAQQGTEGNGASEHPVISDLAANNHYYIAFESQASNLLSGDTNGFSDIFVVDSVTGGIVRVSVSTAGAPADQPSTGASISADGRYVVFQSTATNLVANVSGSHIYLHDRCVSGVGAFDVAGNTATTLIDVSTAGAVADGDSTQPVISADGAHIAFTSTATNLTSPATTSGRKHVYVRNRSNSTTRLLSAATGGGEADADSQTPAINEDGHWVAFDSKATNLVAGDTNGVSDVFVADATGVAAVVRVSETSAGGQGYDPSTVLPYDQRLGSVHPSISADGRYVTFATLDANLTPGDAVGQYQGGGATATATVVGGVVSSIAVTAAGSAYSQATPPQVVITGGGAGVTTRASAYARVADDGTIAEIVVVDPGAGYTAAPTVTIASDANHSVDVLVHDRDVAASGTLDTPGNLSTSLVSVCTFGYQTYSLLGIPSTAASDIYPVISGNGRFIAFPSDAENVAGLAFGATNLLPLDDNTFRDLFLSDQRIAGVASPKDFNPTVAISAPGSGTRAVVNRAVTLRASAVATIGHVASVEFFVDGVSAGVVTTLSAGTSSYETTWTPLATGTYSLSAIVTDNYGDQGVSENVSVTVNAPPTVSVTAPAAGSLLGVGSVYTISASAAKSNSGSTITGVEFFANGVSLGTDTTSPYSVSWMPAYAGNFSLTAVVTETITADSFAIQTTSEPVALSVGSNPVVVISAPTTGSTYLVDTAIPITATTSGGFGEIASVAFYLNGSPLGKPVTAAPYKTTWTPAAAGTYTLSAVVTDANNHTSASTPFTVTITPNQAPTVKLTSPTATTSLVAGNSITLSADADDADGEVVSVAFIAGSKVVGTATTKPFSFTWTPASAGTYSVVARATDDSGNVTTSSPAVTVKVAANQSPTVAITSPTSGASMKVNAATTIAATASDPDGTVASVRFYVNGVALGSADTTAPYTTTWTPSAEGTYKLTAVATDASGASKTSSAVTVVAVLSTTTSADTIYFGNYQAGSVRGRFAAVNLHGYSGSFIGYATNGAVNVRQYGALTVGASGAFASGALRGTFGLTGISGSIDSGVFIGTVAPASTALKRAVGYYSGSMMHLNGSVVTAIVGGDGTIFFYAKRGTFVDVGEGQMSSSGSFSIGTRSGNTIAGKASTSTGLMSGTISGHYTASFAAAPSTASATADGFIRSANARAVMGTGNNTITVGFTTAGTGTAKKLLLRAVGPSGKSVSPSGAKLAADPTLKLYLTSGTKSTLLASNNNWLAADAAVMTKAKAVPTLKTGSKDAALVRTLAAGVYGLQVTGSGGGLARAEIYDTDTLAPFAANRLVRITAQAKVGTGSATLVGQFVISGTSPKRVLIRGAGPALLKLNAKLAVLKNPFLRVRKISGSSAPVIRENDNWAVGNDNRLLAKASAQVGATPGFASGSLDSAILITLPPGTYSAEVLGVGSTSGIAMLEIYEVP